MELAPEWQLDDLYEDNNACFLQHFNTGALRQVQGDFSPAFPPARSIHHHASLRVRAQCVLEMELATNVQGTLQ
eukprot:984876-Rhodomonas_salina.1